MMNWSRSNLSHQDFLALELQGKARLLTTMKCHHFFESEFRKQDREIQYWRWICFALTWIEIGIIVGILFYAFKMKWILALCLLIGLVILVKALDMSIAQEVVKKARADAAVFDFCVAQEMIIVEVCA